MKTIHMILLGMGATALITACDKGGRPCATPGCNTEAGILKEKCETVAKGEKGFQFSKLGEVRQKLSKAGEDPVIGRRVITEFEVLGNTLVPKANGIYIGSQIGVEDKATGRSDLTRKALTEELSLGLLMTKSAKGKSHSEMSIETCGNGNNVAPVVSLREGQAEVLEFDSDLIKVRLTAESLKALNEGRNPLNAIASYEITLERIKNEDKGQAEKDEASGITEVKRTSVITLIPLSLAAMQASYDRQIAAGLDPESDQAKALVKDIEQVRSAIAGTRLNQPPLRQATIVEVTRTEARLRELESVPTSIFSAEGPLPLTEEGKFCVGLPKSAKDKALVALNSGQKSVALSMDEIAVINENIAALINEGRCTVGDATTAAEVVGAPATPVEAVEASGIESTADDADGSVEGDGDTGTEDTDDTDGAGATE